jgi:hypothetical protein
MIQTSKKLSSLKDWLVSNLKKAREQRSLIGTLAGCVTLIVVVFVSLQFADQTPPPAASLESTQLPEPTLQVLLPYFSNSGDVYGIDRQVSMETILPDRPRYEITKYTVVAGDTVIGIAQKFQLKPSTILWGNFLTLGDNPHQLSPGQELNILPMDGVYYQWHKQDNILKVAKFFGVKPEDIIRFPGNRLVTDPTAPVDPILVNIPVDTWLVVPGGHRDFINTTAPIISRQNPAVARLMGPGFCGKVATGAVGSGAFVWPTVNHVISGYDFTPEANHPAIDIGGNTGNAIFAADSGVVVYAGWNDFGYGNVTVIDHGNGWQTLYAHQTSISVACGQSVAKGAQIGNLGSTGRSSGPHLHFEMMINGAKQNPHQFLP